MKTLNFSYLLITLLPLTASMCTGSGDTDKVPTKSNLKIAMVDSLPVDDEDNERHLHRDIRELCDVLVSDTKDCNQLIILDPTISRLDLNKDLSLKTTIERGGSKDISNPKVIGRLIKKNLEEITIPKEFTKPSSKKQAGESFETFISTKAAKDSILIFNTNNSIEDYTIKNRKYEVFTSIEDVRKQMTTILCENRKTNFILLINPPLIDSPPRTTEPKPLTPVVTNKPRPKSKKVHSVDNGNLTIIRGSEGCEVCTRYYSARDNLGRIRQITQSNSTDCCPCGKTIEMKGHTYRMECSGGGNNKLALIE